MHLQKKPDAAAYEERERGYSRSRSLFVDMVTVWTLSDKNPFLSVGWGRV